MTEPATISAVIDWITGTIHDDRENTILMLLLYPDGSKVARPTSGGSGYNVAYANEYGAIIRYHDTLKTQGIGVLYSGSSLNKYREAGVSGSSILTYHATQGATISRLDLALDMKSTRLDASDFMEAIRSGRIKPRNGRKTTYIDTSGNGDTVYIGSRQSERVCRVYDKDLETGTENDWLRVELELKGDIALAAYRRIVREQINETEWSFAEFVKAEVSRMVDWRDAPEWSYALDSTFVPTQGSKERVRQTEKWLLETCAPVLGKVIARKGDNDAEFMRQFLEIANSHAELERMRLVTLDDTTVRRT